MTRGAMGARASGIIAAGAGGLLICGGALTRSWLRASLGEAEVRVGLRSTEVCHDGKCMIESLSALAFSGSYSTMALVAFVASLLAGAALVVAALMALGDRYHLGPIAPSGAGLALSAVALVSAFVALLQFFSGAEGTVGLGYSFYLFAVGIVAGVMGCIFLAKAARASAADDWWE